MIDHLFRHEYGKMVSSLTRLYGVHNLELIEDAVQDTFHKAVLYFRNHPLPENPEAWLRSVVKNRAIDLFRKTNTKKKYEDLSGAAIMSMTDVFSEKEIGDNQLRLLFTICHPELKVKDQIIFALKTFSGFSVAEISSALLIDKENAKKTLLRSRKKIREKDVKFAVPTGKDLTERLGIVHLAIYLLFNEGFHSSSKDRLIRKDLVAEALRLNGLLLDRFGDYDSKALMALMCFHSARLNSKIAEDGSLIKLKNQDRQKWNYELVWKGHMHMEEATKTDNFSRFHWEAAIAGEYVKSRTFEETDWNLLETYHHNLIAILPSDMNMLNLAAIQNQQGKHHEALTTMHSINIQKLKRKEYLFYAVLAEIQIGMQNFVQACKELEKAFQAATNKAEQQLIKNKIQEVKKTFLN